MFGEKFTLLTIGRGGYTKHGVGRFGHVTAHGYTRDPKWMQLEEMEVGAWVISSLDVPVEQLALWTLRCPIPNPELSPGEERKCPEPSDALVAGLQGMFKDLAALRKANANFRGLDEVDVETYVRIHRESGLPFRIGRIDEHHQIVWEDGGKEP